jgi:hypothetical protein
MEETATATATANGTASEDKWLGCCIYFLLCRCGPCKLVIGDGSVESASAFRWRGSAGRGGGGGGSELAQR